MPKTNVLAKVKKIDIQNRIMGDDWKQHITLTLGEIELTDANLCALRNFRPHEEVMVNLSTLQLSVGDLPETQKLALLTKDIDATPAPLPATSASSSSSSASHSVNHSTSASSTASTAASLDLSENPHGSSEVMEGEGIEAVILLEGEEDEVDPEAVLQSFSFR